MKNQTELVLPGEGVPEAVITRAKEIINLLKNATSISVVSEFLRSKDLHFSGGSWEDLQEKRIIPALRAQEISIGDLIRLLNDAEEFGRSHTFLYNCGKKDAARLMDRGQVVKACDRLEISDVLEEPVIEEMPKDAVIAHIREEVAEDRRSWVFKVVETRKYKKLSNEETVGDIFRREWKIEPVRAVSVARLHDSGLLEIRVQSHSNNSNDYQQEVNQMWNILSEFIPATKFSLLSLRKAKDQLWDKREALKKKVRFSDSTMTNDIGTTIVASTTAHEGDLFNDTACTASLDKFLGQGAHCDASDIWFRPVNGTINREIHVLISGENNEFAVPASCTRDEYEYVLNELRVYNK